MKVALGVLVSAALLLAAFALPFESLYRLRTAHERAVEEGIAGLGADTFAERERAVERLVSLGEASRSAVEEALASSDAEVRARAQAVLRELDRRAESVEVRRTKDFERIIRVGLVKPNALRPETNRFAVLSKSPEIAARVAVALAPEFEVENPLRHQRLVILMRDLGSPVAADYLGDLFARGYFLPSTLHHAAMALADLGERGCLPDVRAGLVSPNPFVRKFALKALTTLGGPEDFEGAEDAAADDETMVRAEAARTLAATGGRKALEPLATLARDPQAVVRAAALESLLTLPGTTPRHTALDRLSDPEPKVRAAALELLRLRGEPEDAPAARSLLSDPVPVVRGAAIRAYAALGERDEAVLVGLRDGSAAVRQSAFLVAHGISPETRREAVRLTRSESDPYLRTLRRTTLGLPSTN